MALLAAFVAAYILRVSIDHRPIAHSVHATTYLGLFLLLLPFWILVFGLMGLYSGSIQEKRFTEASRLFIGSLIGLAFVTSLAYFDNDPIFPAKLVPVYGFSLAFIFLLLFRNAARITRAHLYGYGVGITNILIVGNTKVAIEIVESLSDYKISGYHIVGIVTSKAHAKDRYPHIPVYESFEEAIQKIKLNDLHGIVQTELYASGEANNEILEFAQAHHISYRFVPGNSELFVGNIEVELFRSQIPVIAVHQTALLGWGRIVKRLFDVLVGGVLLIIASPLLLIITLLQLLSGGTIFFQQKRLTRFNRQFVAYKFRTVRPAYNGLSPEEAFSKMGKPELIKSYRSGGDQLAGDPRYGRFGNLLRRTSLDELPQLFNVIKGDISLVGPRALVPEELSNYDKKHTILSVKSGITGLAQVSGRRNIDFEERRKLDLYYVQNWSLWMDIMILIKTLRVVIHRVGAKVS